MHHQNIFHGVFVYDFTGQKLEPFFNVPNGTNSTSSSFQLSLCACASLRAMRRSFLRRLRSPGSQRWQKAHCSWLRQEGMDVSDGFFVCDLFWKEKNSVETAFSGREPRVFSLSVLFFLLGNAIFW